MNEKARSTATANPIKNTIAKLTIPATMFSSAIAPPRAMTATKTATIIPTQAKST